MKKYIQRTYLAESSSSASVSSADPAERAAWTSGLDIFLMLTRRALLGSQAGGFEWTLELLASRWRLVPDEITLWLIPPLPLVRVGLPRLSSFFFLLTPCVKLINLLTWGIDKGFIVIHSSDPFTRQTNNLEICAQGQSLLLMSVSTEISSWQDIIGKRFEMREKICTPQEEMNEGDQEKLFRNSMQ